MDALVNSLLLVLERLVDDVDDDDDVVEFSLDNDELDNKLFMRKLSELRDTNEEVLMPESIVGLADFLDDDDDDEWLLRVFGRIEDELVTASWESLL